MTLKMNDAKKQPFPLPPGWKWARLGDYLTDLQLGIACGDKSLTEGVPHLRMNNISAKGEIDLSLLWRISVSADDLKHYRLLPGDILFNNTNSVELVGKTALFNIGEGDFIYSNHLTRIRTRYNELRPGWLALYLRFLWGRRYFERVADRWAGQSAVRDDILKSLPILIPTPVQQDMIISRFDAQMTKVQRMRQAAERQLEATRAMPGALLHQVFRYKEGDTLPPSWRWARLRDVVSDSIEQCNPANRFEDVFTYIDISSVDNVSKRIVSPQVLHAPEAPSRARQIVRTNDVLVATTRPNLNAVALVSSELDGQICSTGFCVLRAFREELARYIFAYVQSPPFVRAVSALVQGALYPAITDDDVKDCWMSLPPPNEQRTIVARLESQMSVIQHIRQAAECQMEAINALPGALLREVFGGFEPPTGSKPTGGYPSDEE